MTQADHDELRRLAEAATAGPWGAVEYADHQWFIDLPRRRAWAQLDDETIEGNQYNASEQDKRDAHYIAAADPATILALLDSLDCEQMQNSLLLDERDALVKRVAELSKSRDEAIQWRNARWG